MAGTHLTQLEKARLRSARDVLTNTLIICTSIGIVLASIVAPGDEPFMDWKHYLSSWAEWSVYTIAVTTLIINTLLALWMHGFLPGDCTARVSDANTMRLLWILLPTVLWSVARIVAAAEVTHGFTFHHAEEHLGMWTEICMLISGWTGSLITVVCISVFAVKAFKRGRWSVLESRRLGLCESCGHRILSSQPCCPECGRPSDTTCPVSSDSHSCNGLPNGDETQFADQAERDSNSLDS